jgi:hypothetical protein
MAFRASPEVARALEDTTRPRTGPLGNRISEHATHQLGLGDPLQSSPPQRPVNIRVYVKAGLLHDVRGTTHDFGMGRKRAPPWSGEPKVSLLRVCYEETLSLTVKVRPSSPRSTRTVSSGPNSPPMMRLLRGFST